MVSTLIFIAIICIVIAFFVGMALCDLGFAENIKLKINIQNIFITLELIYFIYGLLQQFTFFKILTNFLMIFVFFMLLITFKFIIWKINTKSED